MLRYILAALAAIVLFTASIIPDDAYARGGRGGGGRGGGGGFHGGGGFRGGGGYAGGVRPSHPIAGRPGGPIAGRPGRPIAGYPGYGGGYRPGWGYGAAAVGGAALAGAYYGGYGSYGYDPNYGYDDGGSSYVAESDPIAECARRFKTYDPASQTYIKRKGVRASCP
jgi:hypothetical protein